MDVREEVTNEQVNSQYWFDRIYQLQQRICEIKLLYSDMLGRLNERQHLQDMPGIEEMTDMQETFEEIKENAIKSYATYSGLFNLMQAEKDGLAKKLDAETGELVVFTSEDKKNKIKLCLSLNKEIFTKMVSSLKEYYESKQVAYCKRYFIIKTSPASFVEYLNSNPNKDQLVRMIGITLKELHTTFFKIDGIDTSITNLKTFPIYRFSAMQGAIKKKQTTT